MKKAVVLEIKGEHAAVLTDQGLVQKIRNRQYEVGQEITLPDAGKKTFAGWRQAAAAAAVVIALSAGSLYYASENVFAYSTVTVTAENEAVELTLNKKNEVIAAKALDENSKAIADSLKVSVRKRKPLQEAVEILASEMEEPEIAVESDNAGRKENLENDLKKIIPDRSAGTMTEETDAAGAGGGQPGAAVPQGTSEPQDLQDQQSTPEQQIVQDAGRYSGNEPETDRGETSAPADSAGSERAYESRQKPVNEDRAGDGDGYETGRPEDSGNTDISENMQPGTEPGFVPESGMAPSQGRNNMEMPSEGMQGMGQSPPAGGAAGPGMP